MAIFVNLSLQQHIWQFYKKEPITRKTLYLPKSQGGIALIQTEYQFLQLKDKTNQEPWIILTRYILASILYKLSKDFKYMMSHKFAKTDKPKINFYYKDMINDFKKQTQILKLQNNSKIIYKQIIQNQYNSYSCRTNHLEPIPDTNTIGSNLEEHIFFL